MRAIAKAAATAIITLSVLSVPVLAQSAVNISADNFTISETARSAVFSGNVVVEHPLVTVWAPTVTVIYGAGGTSDIESFEATGTVRLRTSDQDAIGERAVFDPAARTLRLTGNVSVVSAAGSVSADDLVVNLDSGTSTFTSGSGGRVTGTFTTQ